MKLYIKQKVFSWKDKFTVKNEDGEDRFLVEGEVFTIGKKLHVMSMTGDEVAFIKEKVMTLLPKFTVFIGEKEAAVITKKFAIRPKYEIEGLNWKVEGSLMGHDYSINENDRPIVTIHKKWMSWGDTYELDITNAKDEVMALAVVLAIDCVMADAAVAAAASN